MVITADPKKVLFGKLKYITFGSNLGREKLIDG